MPGLSGVVVCGGASRRMGTDKALLDLGGTSLLETVARRLALVAEPVVLAPGSTSRYRHMPWPEVLDEVPDSGPLGGIVAALEASTERSLAAVAVDMPRCSPEVFDLLWRSMGGGPDAAVPVTPEGPQPLHAVYARRALPKLRSALARRELSLRKVLDRLEVVYLPEAAVVAAGLPEDFALNLNRSEDLRSYLEAQARVERRKT